MIMKNIVIMGGPGSGKGTQGQILKDKYGLIHFNMGEILRSEYENKSELGIEAASYWLKGNLSPNDIVIGMFDKYIKKYENKCSGFIFDGFPRTEEQAIALDKLMQKFNTKIDIVLCLDVEDSVLKTRLLERGESSNRPDDKDPIIIDNRIKVYKRDTYPVIEYYKLQNKFISINGIGAINEITNNINEIVLN